MGQGQVSRQTGRVVITYMLSSLVLVCILPGMIA